MKLLWLAPILAVVGAGGPCAQEELLYKGRYWEAVGTEPESPARGQFQRCQETGPAEMGADTFFDLEVRLHVQCDTGESASFHYSYGPQSLRTAADGSLRLDFVVFTGRHGKTFVDGFDWNAYHDAASPEPTLEAAPGADGQLQFSTALAELLEPGAGDIWNLTAGPLSTDTPCLAADVSGTVASEFVSETLEAGLIGLCGVEGRVVLAPVAVSEHYGELWIEHPDDWAQGDQGESTSP